MRQIAFALLVLALCFPAFGETTSERQVSDSPPERIGDYFPEDEVIEGPNGEKVSRIKLLLTVGTPQDLKDLLEKGLDPNTLIPVGKEGNEGEKISILRNYVWETDVEPSSFEKIKLLLEAGANPGFIENTSGRTVLHDAAIVAPGPVVSLLINAGADPNQPDNNGTTPYQEALGHANHQAVQSIELKTGFRHPERDQLYNQGIEMRKRLNEKLEGGDQQ